MLVFSQSRGVYESHEVCVVGCLFLVRKALDKFPFWKPLVEYPINFEPLNTHPHP